MNQTLTRWQAIRLALVVLLALGLSGFGLVTLSGKAGFWTKSVQLTIPFAEASELQPGTPVRLSGLEVGQVVSLGFSPADSASTTVEVRVQIREEVLSRLKGDATAQIRSTGLLGGKVLELLPGTPEAGPLASTTLKAGEPDAMTQATNKLVRAAEKIEKIVDGVQSGQGTVGKLLTDDELYQDLRGLAKDSRTMIQKAEETVQRVEGQVHQVEKAVQEGRDTARAAKTTIEGVNHSWIGRKLFDDATALMVRPKHRKDSVSYSSTDLFETNTAILTPTGRIHLNEVANWLKSGHPKDADVVIAALCDPNDKSQTGASAQELTRKQAEVALEYLKGQGVHKIGLVARRKLTAIGLGQGPSPVVEPAALPASYLQVLLFIPQ